MPWRPLPRIAFAIATYPFEPSSSSDLPLELGDELYIIEQGGKDDSWYRGYLVAPPSLLAGLTSVKGQTLEARVFSGIFPRCCVEVREELGDPVQGLNGVGKDDKHFKHADEPAQTDNRGLARSRSSRVDSRTSLELTASRRPEQSRDRRLRRAESDPARGGSSPPPITPELHPMHRHHTAKPPAPVPMLKIGDETPTSEREPLVDEIASCLREWHSTNLHQLLLNRQYGALEKMSAIVSQLDLARRQLLHDVLTAQERDRVREQTTWNLVKGNKMLSGQVIVRDPEARGRLLTGSDSAIDITKLQAVMTLLDAAHIAHPEGPALHHLLLEIKAVTGADLDSTKITLSLCRQGPDQTFSPLSETFALDVSSSESMANMARSSKLKTLFTDLSAGDIGDLGQAQGQQVYLVIKVQESQAPRPRHKTKSKSLMGDGPLPGKGQSASNNPGADVQKGGRRSLMFGSKKSRTGSKEAIAPSSEGRATPQSEEHSAGAADRSRSDAPSLRNSGPSPPVVRTVGVGLLDVGGILRQDEDVEQMIAIWSPAQMDESEEEARHTFDRHITKMLPSTTGRYVRCDKVSRIHVHLSPFIASDADALVRSNPTSMHMITRTQKIGFSEAPETPRSDIYLTLSEASIPRDAVLSHPESGFISVSGGSAMRNLQLTLEVRDASGNRIEQCIFPSSNSPGFTAWRTTVTETGTRWSQVICLRIPKDQVPGLHLIMSVADAPEFPFALSWMPLWSKQAFLKDGPHSLLMHAYDKTTSSVVNGRGAYLSLPWDAAEKNSVSKDESVTGAVATLQLESYLCSTEYSQDQVILGLINWRQQSPAQLMDLLKQIVFVPEIEIVKQLSDVFDALFGIVVNKSGDADYEDLIFTDLVAVLGIVHDRRFNLGPLVDRYAEHRFHFPFATSCLMRSYTRLLENATALDRARHLRAAFKVGRHLLKFIIIARGQQKVKEEGIGITGIQRNFAMEMQSIFHALENLMRNSSPLHVGSKTLVVQHFHTWLPELLAAFSKEEVITLATRFVDACQDVKGKLILYKIILILNFTQLEELFWSRKERERLIGRVLGWLSPYWGATSQVTEQWRDQLRLCCSVVAELLHHPCSELYDFLPKIVASFCTITARQDRPEKNQLAFLFSKTYPFTSRHTTHRQIFDETLLELAALLSSIVKIPLPPAIQLPGHEHSAYVVSLLDTLKAVLECKAYPESWLSLHIYHHRTAMQTLEYIYNLLSWSFLPPLDRTDDFDIELWKAFFMTLLKLVRSDALALETFPEQKRRAVWKIAGDVREQGAELLRRSWEGIGWEADTDDLRRYDLRKLGGYQVQYVPSLVCPIMELCLSVHEGLRHVAVGVLRTMIVNEWDMSEDLGQIETEMIASLDLIFKSKTGNKSITQKMFVGELLDLFEPIANLPDDALWIALRELVTTIDELMDLLVAAHGDSIESSLHTLRLMEFMKDMQKEDIFIRYVHDLARMQDQAQNPTESGLALQSHADLYAWDANKILPAIGNPPFPEQSSFSRREALYFQMIERYEDGQAWKLALGCYQDLTYHYEHTTFDLSKLARAQRSMAKINEAIATQEKPYPRFFRVHYRGLGFPPSIRDKQYVFECSSNERMSTFTDRMQKQYPNASVLQTAPTDNSEGQYLQVSTVSPFRDLSHPVYVSPKVPMSTREHLLVCMPHQFCVTSKRSSTETSVLDQFVEKTLYTTAEPFPNLLRRSEILAVEALQLTPLQTAVERTWRKTADLLAMERRAVAGDDPTYGALTGALGQLLDLGASDGTCLANYRLFLAVEEDRKGERDGSEDHDGNDGPDASASPADPLLPALRIALSDHAAVIRRCLDLYTRPSLQFTRNELTTLFGSAYPHDVRASTPSPHSHHQPSGFRCSNSPSESRSARNASGAAATHSGPAIGPDRPMSGMMSKLSSDIVNQLQDADPRGSPNATLGGPRSRGDRAHQHLSVNVLQNPDGTFHPEQVTDPGAPRADTTSPQQPIPGRRVPSNNNLSLRGGWIDDDNDNDRDRKMVHKTNGTVNYAPPTQTLTATTYTSNDAMGDNGWVNGVGASILEKDHGELDPGEIITADKTPSRDTNHLTLNGKDFGFLGTVQSDPLISIESLAAHQLHHHSFSPRPGSPARTIGKSNDDFGKTLTESLGANISTAVFRDNKKKSSPPTATTTGETSNDSRPSFAHIDTGNKTSGGTVEPAKSKRTSLLLHKWPRKKTEQVVASSSSSAAGSIRKWA